MNGYRSLLPCQTLICSGLMKQNTIQQSNMLFQRFFHSTVIQNVVIPFKLTDIGPGIGHVEILRWFVQPGKHVNEYDPICEVQNEKATVDISSRFDGTISKLYFKVGDQVNVGEALLDIDVPEEVAKRNEEMELREKAVEKSKLEKQRIMNLTSSENPELLEKDDIPVVSVSSAEETKKEIPTTSIVDEDLIEPSTESTKENSSTDQFIATASVRDFAFENKIDLNDIQGTGVNGRIMKEDVISYMKKRQQTESQQKKEIIPDQPIITLQSAPLPQSIIVPDRIETLHGITKSMSKSMNQSLQIPHLGYMDDICLDNFLLLQPHLEKLSEQHHVSITFIPFFIKALSLALSEYPILNSTYIQEREEILYHGSHNIGIALDTPRGLIVPNIKHCELRSVLDIAIELHRIKTLGKQNKLGREDLEDTTITFSNIGKLGGTYSSPIITYPQVCTGNLGKVKKVLQLNKDKQIIESVYIPTSWNVDQRIIDGATLAKLVQAIKYYIENPLSMIAKMR